MPPFREHIDLEPMTDLRGKPELGFDPDKLIEPAESNPESVLSDCNLVLEKVDGLTETRQETRRLDTGNTIYDSPLESGRMLNCEQGKAVPGIEGDCGLVSCENVARLSGKSITEADVVKVAIENELCLYGLEDPGSNGATGLAEIAMVLDLIGITPALCTYENMDEVATEVESGRGVIGIVEVSEFWDDFPYEGNHAVVITSVERDSDGNPCAFYVCDSGSGEGDYARRVDSDRLERSLGGCPLVETESPIR